MIQDKGRIFLLPADFGERTNTTHLILPYVTELAENLKYFIVEEEKTARRYLRRIGFRTDFDEVKMKVLNEHTPSEELGGLLMPLKEGHDVGILSEAGMPCIADPGAQLVKLAHQNHIKVIPIPGPSSIFLTLAGSGLNGQNFSFCGYLPIDKKARQDKIRSLEVESKTHNKCQLFIETPYRNQQLFDDILKTCSPSTLLCIGCELGLQDGWVKTMSISQWKKTKVNIHKRPCVFALEHA